MTTASNFWIAPFELQGTSKIQLFHVRIKQINVVVVSLIRQRYVASLFTLEN